MEQMRKGRDRGNFLRMWENPLPRCFCWDNDKTEIRNEVMSLEISTVGLFFFREKSYFAGKVWRVPWDYWLYDTKAGLVLDYWGIIA